MATMLDSQRDLYRRTQADELDDPSDEIGFDRQFFGATLLERIRSGGVTSLKIPVNLIGLWIFKMIALQPRRKGAPVAASGQFLPSRSRLDATGSDRSLVKRYIRPLN